MHASGFVMDAWSQLRRSWLDFVADEAGIEIKRDAVVAIKISAGPGETAEPSMMGLRVEVVLDDRYDHEVHVSFDDRVTERRNLGDGDTGGSEVINLILDRTAAAIGPRGEDDPQGRALAIREALSGAGLRSDTREDTRIRCRSIEVGKRTSLEIDATVSGVLIQIRFARQWSAGRSW